MPVGTTQTPKAIFAILCYPFVRPRHSHSMIFVHGNALKFRRKFFQCTLKHRAPDPSGICALDFKENFRRFAIWSISATIGIDWSIFLNIEQAAGARHPEKYGQPLGDKSEWRPA
jgi:hypothetical protein